MNLAQFHEHRDEPHAGAIAGFDAALACWTSNKRKYRGTGKRAEPLMRTDLQAAVWEILCGTDEPLLLAVVCDLLDEDFALQRHQVKTVLSRWYRTKWIKREGKSGHFRYSVKERA